MSESEGSSLGESGGSEPAEPQKPPPIPPRPYEPDYIEKGLKPGTRPTIEQRSERPSERRD